VNKDSWDVERHEFDESRLQVTGLSAWGTSRFPDLYNTPKAFHADTVEPELAGPHTIIATV
jgi:hypothetical protein